MLMVRGHGIFNRRDVAPGMGTLVPRTCGNKNDFTGQRSLDLPVFLVSKFLAHDTVDTDHVVSHKIKYRVFRGYMHPPPGSTSFEFLDITLSMGMFSQPVDMLPDNTTVFLGQVPDECPGIVPNFYLHGMPALKTEFFLGLVPGNEVCILVNFVKIPFESS